MLYAVKARFRPGIEERRAALAGDFSQHIRQPLLHIRLMARLVGAGGEVIGVMMLMEADGREPLDHFLQLSPYAQANLYESMDIDEAEIEVGSLG